jgi:hypothetical protein
VDLQDDNARVMAFKLRKPGFMSQFEGFWRMEELPGDKGVSAQIWSPQQMLKLGSAS